MPKQTHYSSSLIIPAANVTGTALLLNISPEIPDRDTYVADRANNTHLLQYNTNIVNGPSSNNINGVLCEGGKLGVTADTRHQNVYFEMKDSVVSKFDILL